MPHRQRSALALFLATILVAEHATAQTGAPDWIDGERIANGEVLFQTQAEGRGTITIELAIRIDADWQSIWRLLSACEISPEYVPHVVACSRVDPESIGEPASADGSTELFLQTVKPAFFLPRFDHVFRLEYFPPDRIEVSHVSGPIDRMDGRWRLLPGADGSVLLLQKMTVKPSFPVPRMFVRNTLERDMPPVLVEIRRRAEASD